MKKILIRADDLGYSEGINYGIAKSVREGIIKSVGIMTNMPAAEQGLKLLADIDVCYGQHTNICIGSVGDTFFAAFSWVPLEVCTSAAIISCILFE